MSPRAGRTRTRHDGPVFTVAGGRPVTGRIRVPGDKSISHRAVLLGALAPGESVVGGLSDGDDVARSVAAVRALGAQVDIRRRDSRIVGGVDILHAPAGALDMGNSGTTMRLLAGIVAGRPWTTVLAGDASLSARPMDRVADPLRAMGGDVAGHGDRCRPPLTIRGGPLHGIDYTTPVASAQVKSCILLAGLGAEGPTVVREPVLTRRHTEELLVRAGAGLTERDDADGGHVVRLEPSELTPFALKVPGDPSQAAFWIVAACVIPGSEVTVEGVYVGAGRRGYLDVLARMGARLEEHPVTGPGDLAATADVTARSGPLQGTVIEASEITGLDEVPVLAVAAACAAGDTVFRSVGELRVKESDRLTGVVDLVTVFGAGAEVDGDDLVVHGTERLTAGSLDAHGDHRMAMAAAVAGLAVDTGSTRIAGWEAVATSYPRFGEDLEALTGAHR